MQWHKLESLPRGPQPWALVGSRAWRSPDLQVSRFSLLGNEQLDQFTLVGLWTWEKHFCTQLVNFFAQKKKASQLHPTIKKKTSSRLREQTKSR